MTNLLAAIKSFFDATPALGSFFAGGYWHAVAPNAPSLPYLVAQRSGSSPPDRCTSNRQRESTRVRFTTVANDDATAAAGADLCEAWFLKLPRQVSGTPGTSGGEYILTARMVGEDLLQDPDRSPDQSDVWYGVKEIEFTIGRNPAG